MSGVTIIEMIVIVAIIAILSGIGFLDLRPLHNEALASAHDFAGTVKQARARAMATTSAYRLVYQAPDRIAVQWRTVCGGSQPWVDETRYDLELRDGTALLAVEDGTQLLCFNSRGITEQSPSLTFEDRRGRTAHVEVLAGGAVRGP